MNKQIKDVRLVYHCQEDGKCKIVIPVSGTIEEVAKKAIPEGTKYRVTHKDLIPKDRTYRDAWTDKHDTDTVDVDMAKAREIHLGRARKGRDAALVELDVETIKALGKGDQKELAAVEAKKQDLRDLPKKLKKKLDACATPGELSKI